MDTSNKVGLAISGGGYRATLYALGSLWRLNQFGMLKKFKTITSVSGGSILTAYLAMNWNLLKFDEQGIATNFEFIIAEPIMRFCKITIDQGAVISGILSWNDTIGDKVAKAYNKHLYRNTKLGDLPDSEGSTEFIFYGTNYQTGSSIRLQKHKISDYKIGYISDPDIELAKVVGISSAFPPIMSPVTLKTNPNDWVLNEDSEYSQNIKLREKLLLCDGGLYDNLGLEAISKAKGNYTHVLCCDAGAPLKIGNKIRRNWASQLYRMTDIMTEQQRALRKRKLMRDYKAVSAEGKHLIYGGTYFGISTKIDKYEVNEPMTKDHQLSNSLKLIRTRLNKFTDEEQGYLINWGYALTDAAIRKWSGELVDPKLLVKGQWPIPRYKL
ncbi:MAG: patatin-like phospholipase family protein [Psychromonas sp.]